MGFLMMRELYSTDGMLEIVDDPAYRANDGETSVTTGDIDGDGRPEIVVATRIVGGKTRIDVFDDAIGGFARLTEYAVVVGDPAASGMFMLRPGLADIDGDGLLEIAIGFPANGSTEGVLQVLDDVETGFAPYLWTGDLDGLIAVPGVVDGVWPAIEVVPSQ